MHFSMSSAKYQPQCAGLGISTLTYETQSDNAVSWKFDKMQTAKHRQSKTIVTISHIAATKTIMTDTLI